MINVSRESNTIPADSVGNKNTHTVHIREKEALVGGVGQGH